MSFGWTGLLSDNLIGNNKGYLEYPKQVSNTCFFSLVCSVVYCNAILFDQFYSESFLFINLFGSSLIHNTDSCYQTTSRLYLVAYVSFVEHRCWNYAETLCSVVAEMNNQKKKIQSMYCEMDFAIVLVSQPEISYY